MSLSYCIYASFFCPFTGSKRTSVCKGSKNFLTNKRLGKYFLGFFQARLHTFLRLARHPLRIVLKHRALKGCPFTTSKRTSFFRPPIYNMVRAREDASQPAWEMWSTLASLSFGCTRQWKSKLSRCSRLHEPSALIPVMARLSWGKLCLPQVILMKRFHRLAGDVVNLVH